MVYLIILLVLIIALVLACYRFPAFFANLFYRKVKIKLNYGISDTVFNNIMAPVIAIVAIMVTYMAFFAQTQFNKEQSKRYERDNVESMISDFIDMHNEHIFNMKVTDQTSGPRSFHFMYWEFRSMQHILFQTVYEDKQLKDSLWNYDSLCRPEIKKEYREFLTKIAFEFFYVGVSHPRPGSGKEDGYGNPKLMAWVHEDETIEKYWPLLEKYILKLQDIKEQNERRVYLSELSLEPDNIRIFKILKIKNILRERTALMNEYFISDQIFHFVDGHMPLLDSHMRSLRTIIMYFNKLDNLSKDDETYFLDMIKCQLSSHEMFMIFLYALCKYDTKQTDWFRNGYLSNVGEKNNLLSDIDRDFLDAVSPHADVYMGSERYKIDSLRRY